MNCSPVSIGQSKRVENFHHYKCSRIGCPTEGYSPHPADKIVWPECRGVPFWHEFGHWIEIILQAIGITKDRYNWARRQVGIQKPCGCQKNQEAANKLGFSLKSVIARIYGRITGK